MNPPTIKARAAPLALRFLAPLCAAPFFLGLWAILRKPNGAAAGDFSAVLCAGNAWIRGASLYAHSDACPFDPSMPYVYPPPLAQAMGALQRGFGPTFEVMAAGALFGLCLASVARRLVAGPRFERMLRAPFFCALTAKALVSGNVSLLFHAALLIVAAHAGLDALLLPLVVVCGVCKPTFAVFAALFLFLDRPWLTRIALTGASLAAIAAYFAGFRALDPTSFAAWIDAAKVQGVAQSGHSFLALPGVVALPELVRVGLYVPFAAALLAAGLLASTRLNGDGRARVIVGVAVCALLNPRLMSYDHITLPFGMAAISAHLASGSPRRLATVGAALAAMWVGVVAWSGVLGGEILFLSCVGLICACALRPAKVG